MTYTGDKATKAVVAAVISKRRFIIVLLQYEIDISSNFISFIVYKLVLLDCLVEYSLNGVPIL